MALFGAPGGSHSFAGHDAGAAELDYFGVGVASAGWLITAYLAAMASLQPVAGKLGDRLGRRRLVIGGLLAFGATSVGAALAPNLWVLLAFRTLQAVAGALIFPNGAALLREAVPEGRRGRSFGSLGVAIALAAGAGPPIGGILVEAAGWRAIFYANLVLVAPAVVLGWHCLPHPKLTAATVRFDLPGALLLPVVLVLSAGLLMSVGRGLSPVLISVGVVGAVAIGAAFAAQELRHPDPVFQPRLFRRRAVAAANGGIGLGNLSMYTLLLSVPLLLIDGDGVSSLRTGMVLAALSASMIVLAPAGGTPRRPVRPAAAHGVRPGSARDRRPAYRDGRRRHRHDDVGSRAVAGRERPCPGDTRPSGDGRGVGET